MWQEINYKEDSNDLLVPNITYKINPAEIESIEANSIAQEIGFDKKLFSYESTDLGNSWLNLSFTSKFFVINSFNEKGYFN